MTLDSDGPTLTAAPPAENPTPRPSLRRLAAPLQLRDPDRYEVLGEHGRGGLGTVSRAHDKELGRDVAIKELISRGDIGEIRFLREAMITARLEHPGIVPIYEAGRWPDGTPFYAMKLVAGRSLKELIAERRTIEDRLELLHHVIAVADAVAYAHERKIIHRDLKASNVIAGDFGETIVIDWGLAKDLTATDELGVGKGLGSVSMLDDLTATGDVLGTPMYMAPEQLRGEAVDQRADVFAIGTMLWQLCSLERGTLPEPRHRDRELRRAGIDKDLAAIIAKAAAPDPRDRYRDAGELTRDLKAFKSGARIAARRYSLFGMLAHWTRRRRALAATIATGILLATAVSIAFVVNIAAERRRAEQANDELVLQNAELRLQRDPTDAAAALARYRGKDKIRGSMLLAEAEGHGVAEAVFAPHTDTIWFLAGGADGAVYSLAADRRIRVTKDGISTTIAADLSTSGVHNYSAASGLLAYARAPAGIAVLDLKTRRFTRIDAITPTELALAPDGSRLAALDARGGVTVWSLAPVAVILKQQISGGIEMVFADPERLIVRAKKAVVAITFGLQQPGGITAEIPLRSLHARGDDVIVGDDSGHLTLLSRALAPIATLSVCHQRINGVRLAGRASLIAFACQDGLAGVARYDAQRGVMFDVETFPTHAASYSAIPDAAGARVVVRADSNIAYLYDTETRLVARYAGHAGRVSTITAPSADLERVLVGDVNGTVRVWTVPRRHARVILQAARPVYGVTFSLDGKFVITGGRDGTVYRVKLEDGTVTELKGHQDIVRHIRLSPVIQSFLSLSNDGTIRAWSPTREEPIRVFADHASAVGDAEYIEGGRRVVSVGDDGRLLAWSPEANDAAVRFRHPLPLVGLEVLKHNSHVAVHDSAGAVWDVSAEGVPRQVRTPDGDMITMLRASSDGRLLAIGTGAGAVTIYGTGDYRILHRTTMSAGIRQINFDPRDRDLLIASEDGHVRVMALDARRTLPWRELAVAARDVAYSRDGDIMAFVCSDGGAWFHSVRTNSWVYTHDHDTDVLSSKFSPDGARFASADRGGVVVLRDVSRTFDARSR